jgi:hypothetical protein
VAPVHAVKVTDREGALIGKAGLAVSAKDFHGLNYRFYSAASQALLASGLIATISLYIDTQ